MITRPQRCRLFIPIDQALADAKLLGAALGDTQTWHTWRAVLKAAFGLELNREQAHAFASVAGSRQPPAERVRELWCIVGRRGGKSKVATAIAVYLAVFVQHRLSAGERGLVLCLAASTEQARVVFGYAKAFLTESPVLRQEIDEITRSEIRLLNGITIGIHSNSFRTIRGRTLCGCVFDEVAIWRDELSATPDIEVCTAVLPALLTTRGMLIGISTGYRRTGLLYNKFENSLVGTVQTRSSCKVQLRNSIRRLPNLTSPPNKQPILRRRNQSGKVASAMTLRPFLMTP